MSSAKHLPSLGSGLLAALIFSACGAALLAALAPWLGLAYVLYAIGRSGERVGRITTLVCWLVVACGAWLAGLPLVAYVLVHLGAVWLVRSLYYYSGLMPALADLGVTLLGAAFAVSAAQRADSAWLAFWCFFLVQAFHVSIPASLTRGSAPEAPDDAFARAHRAAEAAVRRLSSAR